MHHRQVLHLDTTCEGESSSTLELFIAWVKFGSMRPLLQALKSLSGLRLEKWSQLRILQNCIFHIVSQIHQPASSQPYGKVASTRTAVVHPFDQKISITYGITCTLHVSGAERCGFGGIFSQMPVLNSMLMLHDGASYFNMESKDNLVLDYT